MIRVDVKYQMLKIGNRAFKYTLVVRQGTNISISGVGAGGDCVSSGGGAKNLGQNRERKLLSPGDVKIVVI